MLPLHVPLEDELGGELEVTYLTVVLVLVFQLVSLGHVFGEIIVALVTLLTGLLRQYSRSEYFVTDSHMLINVGELLSTEITEHLDFLVDIAIVFVEIVFGVSRVVALTAGDSLLFLWFDGADAVRNQSGLDEVEPITKRAVIGGRSSVEDALADGGLGVVHGDSDPTHLAWSLFSCPQQTVS